MNSNYSIQSPQLAESIFARTEDLLPDVCASLKTGDLVNMREVCHLFNRLVLDDYHSSLWMQNQPVTTKTVAELQTRKRATGNTLNFMQALQFSLKKSKQRANVKLSNVEFSRDAVATFTDAATRVETLILDKAKLLPDDSQEPILLDIAKLVSLRRLDITYSKLNKLVLTMSTSCSLTSLILHNTFTEGLEISHAKKLKRLELSNCENLREPPNLQNCKDLEIVQISDCDQLVASPDLRNLPKLRMYAIDRCNSLRTSAHLQGCNALEEYFQRDCEGVREPPDLRYLPCLLSVEVYGAKRLQSAPCVTGCDLLETYILEGNDEITIGPDFGRLDSLTWVVLRKLTRLNVVGHIQSLPKLQKLTLEKLPSLTEPPLVRDCPNLESISFKGCDVMQSIPQLHDSLPKLSKIKKPKHLAQN